MICVKEAADDLMIVPNHTCRKNRIIASYHHRAGVGRVLSFDGCLYCYRMLIGYSITQRKG